MYNIGKLSKNVFLDDHKILNVLFSRCKSQEMKISSSYQQKNINRTLFTVLMDTFICVGLFVDVVVFNMCK